jgi:hypothetical protein
MDYDQNSFPDAAGILAWRSIPIQSNPGQACFSRQFYRSSLILLILHIFSIFPLDGLKGFQRACINSYMAGRNFRLSGINSNQCAII